MKAVPFDHYIFEKLQDPEFAAWYLYWALEDGGVEEFLMASNQYAQAHHMTGRDLALSETAIESLKAALAFNFEAYVSVLRAAVASAYVQDIAA